MPVLVEFRYKMELCDCWHLMVHQASMDKAGLKCFVRDLGHQFVAAASQQALKRLRAKPWVLLVQAHSQCDLIVALPVVVGRHHHGSVSLLAADRKQTSCPAHSRKAMTYFVPPRYFIFHAATFECAHTLHVLAYSV